MQCTLQPDPVPCRDRPSNDGVLILRAARGSTPGDLLLVRNRGIERTASRLNLFGRKSGPSKFVSIR